MIKAKPPLLPRLNDKGDLKDSGPEEIILFRAGIKVSWRPEPFIL
jgi:hypothetical protein